MAKFFFPPNHLSPPPYSSSPLPQLSSEISPPKDNQSSNLIDHFQSLDLPKIVTSRDCKSIYRRLTIIWHPDKWNINISFTKSENNERFKCNSNTYEKIYVLKNKYWFLPYKVFNIVIC